MEFSALQGQKHKTLYFVKKFDDSVLIYIFFNIFKVI